MSKRKNVLISYLISFAFLVNYKTTVLIQDDIVSSEDTDLQQNFQTTLEIYNDTYANLIT